MEPAAVGRGAFLPSLVAVCRSQKEPRHRPPDVSPLRDPSAFGNEDEYNRYVKERRKAKERLREFRRPPRDRKGRHQRGRAHPSRERETERRLQMTIAVPVGQKQAPPMAIAAPVSIGSSSDWACHFVGRTCLKPFHDQPQPPAPYTVLACKECDWLACERCLDATAHLCADDACGHELVWLDHNGVCDEDRIVPHALCVLRWTPKKV